MSENRQKEIRDLIPQEDLEQVLNELKTKKEEIAFAADQTDGIPVAVGKIHIKNEIIIYYYINLNEDLTVDYLVQRINDGKWIFLEELLPKA